MTRILIVDDEPDITLSFKMMLEGDSFKVDTYNDPVQATGNFKAGAYDLVILDIRMPKMDGFQLYEELKKIDDKVKVVFITAFDINYEGLRKMYPELRIDSFVRKPVDSEYLINVVKDELRRP